MPRGAALIAALAAAAVALLALPSIAQASQLPCTSATTCIPATSKHSGQRIPNGYVGAAYVDPNYCPPGRMCTMMYVRSTPAWRYTGGDPIWAKSSIAADTVVYAHYWSAGYTGDWFWVWNKGVWYAVLRGDLYVPNRGTAVPL
jgi:hypothetical protein